MRKLKRNLFKIGILTLSMACSSVFGVSYGYAEEVLETVQTIGSESFEVIGTETETMNSDQISPQTGYEENSFRYENGEWQPNGISMFSEDFIPWSFQNGSWINSVGEPIPGALEKGIDVSFIQGEIDWEKVQKTDVSFAILRCGYGNDFTDQDDEYWKYNADECTRLGIPFGVYIYSYALDIEEAKSEAEHVLRLVKDYDLSYPIYLDLEDEKYTGSLSNEEIADIAEVFRETVEEAGYEVGVYANLNWFRNRLTDSRFRDWTKWVAQYNTECEYEGSYSMWQCTSTGSVDGVDGAVDLNFTMDSTQEDPEDPEEPKEPTREEKVEQFVKRFYELVLDREPDLDGLEGWKQNLLNHTETGSDVLQGFILSDEFTKKNISDEAYVELLYETCLGRKYDKSGKQSWVQCLESGLSRKYVLKGFAESSEFTDICNDYEIVRGNVTLVEKEDSYPEITQYLYRCYRVFLDREPDIEGLRSWIDAFVVRMENPGKITEGFVMSDELRDKNFDNEEFVKILYKGLFDRNADKKGLEDWLSWMDSGKTRNEVFWGFANSEEFNKLVKSFGL